MHDRETPVPSSYIPWRLFWGLLLVSLILGAFFVLRPFSLTFGDRLGDALTVLYGLFLALVCFRGSWRPLRTQWKQMGQRFIPVLLGIGTLWTAFAFLVGWVLPTLQTQQVPTYPSLYHVLSFGAYPFIIAAVLLLPSQNLSRLSRLRILCDSFIIMTTVAILYSYVILVPILITTRGTLLQKIVGSLFTAADLVLLLCLLFVALQVVRGAIRQIIVLLTLAIVLLLISHVASLPLLLSPALGFVIRPSPGLLGSLPLFAVAAQTMRRVLDQGVSAERGSAVLLEETEAFAYWKTWLVPLQVLIFALLLVSLAIQHTNAYTPARLQVVVFGGTAILVVLVLRQLLSVHELSSLKRDLRAMNSELHILNAQLDKLAASDPLTGVPNHRTLVTRLDEEVARAEAQQAPCSALFMDIDHFKAINDQYGHAVGDLVLCRVAERAASTLQPEDCLGRWGGEEFVAVLPGKDLNEAFAVAEQIRVRVSELVFADQEALHVTCSLGVATYPLTDTKPDMLIQRADHALYVAKHRGRNQVQIAHKPEETGFVA